MATQHLDRLTVDPMDVPTYSVRDAARYLRIPEGTLRSWMKGQTYQTQRGSEEFIPVIPVADAEQNLLAFNNLVEAHVLRSLRVKHEVPLQKVRKALHYAESTLGMERLLLNGRLRTVAGDLFLEHFRDLVNLNMAGRIALRRFFDDHLERVTFEDDLPVRMFPFLTPNYSDGSRSIAIDPNVSFGKAILADWGVTTQIIARRVIAGETIEDLSYDYDIPPKQLEDAVVFEAA